MAGSGGNGSTLSAALFYCRDALLEGFKTCDKFSLYKSTVIQEPQKADENHGAKWSKMGLVL